MRAPHQGGSVVSGASSPHAALLIDFDNVTMGMRSDLSKELKTLLDSDVIKGKVSVQRAYADWRRYPQYIVPLSEASVDLIFAPAYGSNKKNATDIRMAIDALELVFIRPEIGTYILLTGDSDFSSLVLKLKEYGKYVIGVGIQESSSDILVQNCDEYYSYTSLTGLTKTTDLNRGTSDPWVLVKDAVAKMVSRDDVMRSDRLKQVMQEIDPNFDEGAIGFSKFSKFLTEASSRGLVTLKKMDNGQYEIEPARGGRGGRSSSSGSDNGRGRRDRKPRGGRRERSEERAPESQESRSEGGDSAPVTDAQVQAAIDVLTETLERLVGEGRDSIRDSDVKRKILEKHPDFDEGTVGFPKFSKFLSEAEDRGAIVITKTDNGSSEITLPRSAGTAQAAPAADETRDLGRAETTRSDEAPPASPGRAAAVPSEPEQAPTEPDTSSPTVIEVAPPKQDRAKKLGPRRGSTRRRSGTDDGSVPLFEGQAVAAPSKSASKPEAKAEAPAPSTSDAPSTTATRGAPIDLKALGLPSDPDAIVRYMAHRYKGVGEKTAETLVERFGTDVFTVLRDDPDVVRDAVPGRRGDQVLEAWAGDYERRTASRAGSG